MQTVFGYRDRNQQQNRLGSPAANLRPRHLSVTRQSAGCLCCEASDVDNCHNPPTPATVAAGRARQRKRALKRFPDPLSTACCSFVLTRALKHSVKPLSRACCGFLLVLLAALQPCAPCHRLSNAFKATFGSSSLQTLPRALKHSPKPLFSACCSFVLVLLAAFYPFAPCHVCSLAVCQAPSRSCLMTSESDIRQ